MSNVIVSLSPQFISVLEKHQTKSKLIEQLVQDIDINKFKEVLGLVKVYVSGKEIKASEQDSKESLGNEDVKQIIESLIIELYDGINNDIICIIHNFLKASIKRDSQFIEKVDKT